jgi:hypothetical protein
VYAIIKDSPNEKVTKKLFRIAVLNFIFDCTRVPFRPHSVSFLSFKGSNTWILCSTMSFLPFQSWEIEEQGFVEATIEATVHTTTKSDKAADPNPTGSARTIRGPRKRDPLSGAVKG